jgi:uncharacterized low-complexity protein
MAISKKPLAAALGAAFLASSISPLVTAESNPFSAQELSGGYDLANYDKHEDGSCGEGSCGGDKSDGEGSCGGEKADGEGSCGGEKADGEGSCGGEKADGEGSCGG